MKKVDEKFVDFLVNGTTDIETAQYVKDAACIYEKSIFCAFCNSLNVKIIVNTSVNIKCKDCHVYSDGISLDNIASKDYNAVTFLHEKKIIEILEANGKI